MFKLLTFLDSREMFLCLHDTQTDKSVVFRTGYCFPQGLHQVRLAGEGIMLSVHLFVCALNMIF